MAINNPVITDSEWLQATAVEIQNKDGGSKMGAPDFASRIRALPTGGTLIPKTITENGVYNATDDDADGYDVVTVGVPEKNTLDEYFAGTLEVANIPSATGIMQRFFENNLNLVSVIMPNVTGIASFAFQHCENLALTSLPSGVTDIGVRTFRYCLKLTLTSLPSGVTSIGDYCFEYCTSIEYLNLSNLTQIPTIGTRTFANTTFPFYFRDQQQLDEWAAATNWSIYANRFQIKPSEVI